MRRLVAGSLVVLSGLALAGCEADLAVYFVNNTDRTFYLKGEGATEQGWRLRPGTTSRADILAEGKCSDVWRVYDENGVLVKDPGRICWHGTYSIP